MCIPCSSNGNAKAVSKKDEFKKKKSFIIPRQANNYYLVHLLKYDRSVEVLNHPGHNYPRLDLCVCCF